jgi:hypothetical protein
MSKIQKNVRPLLKLAGIWALTTQLLIMDYCSSLDQKSLNNFFREVPHVTLLLVWTHKRDDVSLKINIILTLMKQSCPSSTVIEIFIKP